MHLSITEIFMSVIRSSTKKRAYTYEISLFARVFCVLRGYSIFTSLVKNFLFNTIQDMTSLLQLLIFPLNTMTKCINYLTIFKNCSVFNLRDKHIYYTIELLSVQISKNCSVFNCISSLFVFVQHSSFIKQNCYCFIDSLVITDMMSCCLLTS